MIDNLDQDIELNDLALAIDYAINQKLIELELYLPAVVVAYNPSAKTVDVQPLIKIRSTSNQEYDRAVVPNVPVFFAGNSSYSIHFSLSAGDIVLLKSCDRDISNYITASDKTKTVKADTNRMFKFSDAYAVPLCVGNFSTDNSLTIQHLNNNCSIKVSANEIRIKAPTIIADGNVQINGSLTGGGDITATGAINATGGITSAGGITGGGGLSLASHVHGGVTVGGDTTGVAQ
jgi:phage baseplate assembly protein gpV